MKRAETPAEKRVRLAEQHIIHTAIAYTSAYIPELPLKEEFFAKMDGLVLALKTARKALGVERRAATRAGRRA